MFDKIIEAIRYYLIKVPKYQGKHKRKCYGEFTLANFAHDFALSLHVLPKKNFFHY